MLRAVFGKLIYFLEIRCLHNLQPHSQTQTPKPPTRVPQLQTLTLQVHVDPVDPCIHIRLKGSNPPHANCRPKVGMLTLGVLAFVLSAAERWGLTVTTVLGGSRGLKP